MSERRATIEVRDLVKVYQGGTRALDGITFEVTSGELFGFLGPNGAGKTTTIRILATLLQATAGTARLAGFDVATQPKEVRQRLGLAMQTPTLDAFSTGRETLELAGRLHRMPSTELRRRTDELLELMGLASVATKLTGTYSGGMRRRLDLASALMHRPEVLILDEPTEGLDPQSRTALWEELERISASGTTMLLTTHYMEEADRLCSRLAIVDNGQIVVDGAPGELKRSVGADTVVLQLEPVGGDGQVARVRQQLAGLVEPDAVTAHPSGVSLAVPNASAAIPTLLRRLDEDGDGLLLEYRGGYLDKLRASPISRWSILAGEMVPLFFQAAMMAGLLLVVSLLLGAKIVTGVGGFLLILVLAGAFGIAFAGANFIPALLTRSEQTTSSLSLLLFPLVFMSTAFVPEALMPTWIQAFNSWNPITYLIEAIRSLMVSGYDWSAIGAAVLSMAIMGLVLQLGTLWAFDRLAR